MIRNDQRAERLATWLRGKGYKCHTTPEESCVDASVVVENTDWHFTFDATSQYFPVKQVGTCFQFCAPVRSRAAVLALLAE